MNSVTKIIGLFGLCLIGATQLGNGCTSDGGGGGYDDDYYNRPRPDYGGRPDYDRPNSGRPDYGDRDIPRDARIVAEGRDEVLQYRAPSSGRIWLTDADRRTLIDERAIQRGEEYIISTKHGKIWINKDRVRDVDFNGRNIHRIYFRSRDNEGGSSGGGGGNWRPPSEMRDSERVAYGRGDLSYEAPRDGRVWVVDRTRGEIVYRGDVRRSERVRVSPREDYISLSTERKRGSSGLNPNHDYEIYYQRTGGYNDRNDSSKDNTSGGQFSGAGATVPKSASLVREGRNQDLSFQADAAGTVYLWDTDSKTTVQTYRVRNGQRFTVSPKTGETAIDGKNVGKNSLKTNRTYRLYFDRSV